MCESLFFFQSSKRLFRKQCKELFLTQYSQVRRMKVQKTFSIKIFLKETDFDLTHCVLKFKANLLKTGKRDTLHSLLHQFLFTSNLLSGIFHLCICVIATSREEMLCFLFKREFQHQILNPEPGFTVILNQDKIQITN